MAKSLDAELAAIAAEERKLAERRQAHQAKVREAAVGAVEKAGLFKVPLDRLEGLMKAVKTRHTKRTQLYSAVRRSVLHNHYYRGIDM